MSEIISNISNIGDVEKVVKALMESLKSMQKITSNEDGKQCLIVIHDLYQQLVHMMNTKELVDNTNVGVAPAPTSLPRGP